jgi:hypothetical protein
MPPALKVLTWHLPELTDSPLGSFAQPDASQRAAQAILALPPREQPDIIAFNGVTDRAALLKELSPTYPHDTLNMGGTPGSGPDEVSGLMLFSRLPFLPLPIGGSTYYEPFKNAPAPDFRGVGVVRVAGPFDPTTIAFAHTFASDSPFAASVDPAAVRELEFAFIRAVLLKVANGNLQHYANGVIVGNLNVQGETTQTLSEVRKVFAGVPGTFGGDFADGWATAMHAPNDLTGHDPGYTQRLTLQFPERLNYQCTRRDADVDVGLVAHHMSTPLRLMEEVSGISGTAPRTQYADRWGLLARLHRINPHCTPSTAFELLKAPPVNPSTTGSKVWMLPTVLGDKDMYHWVYIESAGTYFVFVNASLEVAAFRRSDLTHELASTDLSMGTLPPAVHASLQGSFVSVAPRFEDKGSVYASREPFFLRFRGASAAFSGQSLFAVVQHHGESPETAFVLQAHQPLNPGLPSGQKLGTTDDCFFRADRLERFSKAPYDDRFAISNPARASFTVKLCTVSLAPLDTPQNSSAPELELHRMAGAETVFLVLTRADVNDVDFSVTWKSALSYLTLETISLEVNEETGFDWGSDELELSVSIDGENVYTNTWDDADSDEDWPNLAPDIRSAVQAKIGQPVDWVRFSDEILFSIIKTDGIFAHGSSVGRLAAMQPDDGDVVVATGTITISDPAGDGEVLIGGELRRFGLY